MPIEDCLHLVNWNIGGAKYLELRKEKDSLWKKGDDLRDKFKEKLNEALRDVLRLKPHVVTLQEVIKYQVDGIQENAEGIIEEDTIDEYTLHEVMLIDTNRHSHQGKWNKVIIKGGWDHNAFFAQGNAILVRKDIKKQMFPIMSLPGYGISYSDWLKAVNPEVFRSTNFDTDKSNRKDLKRKKYTDLTSTRLVEDIYIFSGLYLGNRDTEPRAASVIHFSVDLPNKKIPLDIFIINTHLTTLTTEREGVPSIDKEASRKRLTQLDIIMDGIISEYNLWRKDKYKIRGEEVERIDEESDMRCNPIWILAGDLNFTPDSIEYREIKAQNFIDLIEDHKLGTKSRGLGKDPTLTVDYVFAGPLFESIDPTKLKRQSNKVIDDPTVKVSDHFPVSIKLQLNNI